MIVLLILVVAFVLTFLLWITIDWLAHLVMVKDSTKICGWGNYWKFIREFDKYDWKQSELFKDSLFDGNQDCEFHANIIKFSGIGMRMITPFDLFWVKRYVKKYIQSEFPSTKASVNYKW
jgi:hypothetical protein